MITLEQMDVIRLVEECGEVVQAATKILRFGQKGSYCDGTANVDKLITELGDLLACIDRLHIPTEMLEEARLRKHIKIQRLAPYELGFDCELNREEREILHGVAS